MLSIAGLHKAYDAFELGPLDLSVSDEVLAVLGPSGCGKTTLLSLLAGTVPADGGTVTLDGTRLDARPPERRGTVLVFQEGALFPHMTARENVAYAATDEADVVDLAARLGIEGVLEQRADTLSGGEAQRVALARALAAEPDALLLDEPLANLDAPIRRRLRVEVRDLLADLTIPVVYVTHDQTAASSVGDRVAVMRDGGFEQVESPAAVFARPATPFVAGFTGSENVFRATVGDGDRLAWGSVELDASVAGVEPGEAVWFTVRPEYVEVLTADGATAENVLAGHVANRLFEGDSHRLVVEPDGVDAAIDVSVPSPAYAQKGLADRDRVAVRLPPDAVHVVGSAAGTDPPGRSSDAAGEA